MNNLNHAIRHSYREIVNGRKTGPAAGVARGVLQVLELPYRLVVELRNRRYDRDLEAVQRVPVPVVSVGNLTMGGTGKTPMVAWLANWFRRREIQPVIVSRGYGSRSGEANDEARELAEQLPDVPHVQHADRVRAAQQAIDEHGAQVILLDDGFQHRRLHRELDIVLVDALCPFGSEHLIPRGTLREPVQSLGRADVVILTRSDMRSEAQREWVRKRVAKVSPQTLWLEAAHRPVGLVDAERRPIPLARLRDKPIVCFCGIGNPDGFKHALAQLGCQIVGFLAFSDHCAYGEHEIKQLQSAVADSSPIAVVCTRKDLVKIPLENINEAPLWALSIELDMLSDGEPLESKLSGLISQDVTNP